jgi:hypothetical protein
MRIYFISGFSFDTVKGNNLEKIMENLKVCIGKNERNKN